MSSIVLPVTSDRVFGDSSRVADPTSERCAIEARYDRDTDVALGLCDVLEIHRGVDAELRCDGFDLLFEQRMKNHCGSARLFHRTDIVDLLRERRSGWHQRRTERESEIIGRQIHRSFLLVTKEITAHCPLIPSRRRGLRIFTENIFE